MFLKDWTGRTTRPVLQLEPLNLHFARIQQLSPEECNRYYRYHRSKNKWVFSIRPNEYPQLLKPDVRVFLAGDFNNWSEAIGQKIWEVQATKRNKEIVYEVSVPLNKIPQDGPSAFKFVTDQGHWLNVPDSAPNLISENGVNNFEFHPSRTGSHVFRFYTPESYNPVGNEKIFWVDEADRTKHDLRHTQFLLNAQTDLELGAVVRKGKTSFRLFAPRATGVQVSYSRNPDGSKAVIKPMQPVEVGVWERRVNQNLDGYYYHYYVDGTNLDGKSTHFDASFPVLDPYAKACVGHRGPGIVIAPERIPKVRSNFQTPALHDLVILEAHIRDLVAHAPIELSTNERNGYLGLRKWLKAEGSYLREIGVNAIELQPVQEFDNPTRETYHWGYMTVNYFSPESSYAANPKEASQIEEFRELVQDFHAHGMAVILDVVYNHVGEPNHLLFIDKYYYFQMNQAHDLMNWSGCGNDLRCNTPMGRRLIIESLTHLVETYGVDGFRFDLAELIGIEVLHEIEVELKKIKPSIILIAEPWSFRGDIRKELRESGFASWNDGFRESIAKYVRAEGNQDMVRYFMAASPGTTRFAAQTINYTESHDDRCWLDRITECLHHNGSQPTLTDRRRTHLMASLLFASLGVPMLASGQDFMRSKTGISNTYRRGDLNGLDYNQRHIHSGTHEYFCNWIRFRQSERGRALRYEGNPTEDYLRFYFTENSSAAVVVFNADAISEVPQLVFGINPHSEYANIECETLNVRALRQIADRERFDLQGIRLARIPITGQTINLPPVSCGLWELS